MKSWGTSEDGTQSEEGCMELLILGQYRIIMETVSEDPLEEEAHTGPWKAQARTG